MRKLIAKDFSEFFGKTTIILIILGFYFSYLVEGLTQSTSFRIWMLAFSLLFYFAKIVSYPKIDIHRTFFDYVLLALPIAFISAFFWYSLSEINVYFSLVSAFIIITSGFEFFKKALKIMVWLMLILALYEFASKSYLFVVIRNTEWGLLPLDPKFFGGYAKIFRAKALFEGPLALAQFAIGIGLLFNKNLKIIIAAIVLAVLSNGRLAIVLCAIILLLYLNEKYSLMRLFKSKKGLWTIFSLFIAGLIIGNYFITEKSIQRIKNMFNASDSANFGRLYYWDKAIDVFLDYNFFHKIFGNSGYFRFVFGNSAENGWLMLLLNNGVLGFLYYLFPLLILALLSMQYKSSHYLFIALLFIAMMIQTFHLGVSANLLYWLILYGFYSDLKILKNA